MLGDIAPALRAPFSRAGSDVSYGELSAASFEVRTIGYPRITLTVTRNGLYFECRPRPLWRRLKALTIRSTDRQRGQRARGRRACLTALPVVDRDEAVPASSSCRPRRLRGGSTARSGGVT